MFHSEVPVTPHASGALLSLLTALLLAPAHAGEIAPEDPAVAPPAETSAETAAATPAPVIPALTALSGEGLPAEAVDGKVVLFVNVASRCGYTPQYEGLQALYESYSERGLAVVGVPCNQFGGQEPGTAEEIASFCSMNYGVEFPMLSKQEVNGDGRSDLYSWLVSSEAGGGKDIKWNFEKFLVDRQGAVVARFPSKVKPDDPDLIAAIEAAL